MKRAANKSKRSNGALVRRPRRRARKLTAKMLEPYRRIFGGKIPPGALKQIAKEYGALKNPGKGAFERCVRAVAARGGAVSPRGVCAAAGRKKYGAAQFAQMAAAGKRAKHRRRKNVAGLASELFAQGAVPVLQRASKEFSRSNRKTAVKFKGKKRTTKKNAGRRRNPLEQSQKVYEGFHGRPSSETVTITTPIHEHKYLSGIGELIELQIRAQSGAVVRVKDFKGAVLAQNEKRTQLFVEGGDQRVDLKAFGIREPIHEKETLGELDRVDYYTVKDHLGDEGGEAIYRHKLKKYAFRRKPTVIYDTVNHLIEFAGGNYSIPDEGILD